MTRRWRGTNAGTATALRPWGPVDVRLADPDGGYLRVTGRAG